MPTLSTATPQRVSPVVRAGSGAGSTLAAAVLGFFVITLDAVVVNVALPSIRRDLGGGITGLQWMVDGYTLTFAALLLSAGALTVAVFGALLANQATFIPGLRTSLLLAAGVALAAAAASRFLTQGKDSRNGRQQRAVGCREDVR